MNRSICPLFSLESKTLIHFEIVKLQGNLLHISHFIRAIIIHKFHTFLGWGSTRSVPILSIITSHEISTISLRYLWDIWLLFWMRYMNFVLKTIAVFFCRNRKNWTYISHKHVGKCRILWNMGPIFLNNIEKNCKTRRY